MLDPYSFLDSGPEVPELAEKLAADTDLVGYGLDPAGTLFASFLAEETNTDNINTVFSEIMGSTSDSEGEEILDYLSKTEENLIQEENVNESVRKTRSCKMVVSNKDNITNIGANIGTNKESIYSRPPLMCSSRVNMKSPRVELKKLDSSQGSTNGKNSDKCMNKNAIIARENREKKKQYIKNLENDLELVRMENFDLTTRLDAKTKQCDSMQKEIKYLRNVLANQSCISALLNNIHATKGVAFTSSLKSAEKHEEIISKKRPLDENDNHNKHKGIYVRATGSHKKCKKDTEKSLSDDNSPPQTPCSSPDEVELDVDAGVCLHINNNKVSLELCSKCAENSSNAWNKSAKIDVPVKENTVNHKEKTK